MVSKLRKLVFIFRSSPTSNKYQLTLNSVCVLVVGRGEIIYRKKKRVNFGYVSVETDSGESASLPVEISIVVSTSGDADLLFKGCNRNFQ